MADEYEIPQYSDSPFIVYKTANEIIEFMEKNIEYRYGLYWRSKKESEPKYAMVFYTTDGEMILGLSVYSFDDMAEHFLKKLKEFSDSKFGYYIAESPPFETAEEFRKSIK